MNISISIPGDGSALKGTVPVTVFVSPTKNLKTVSLLLDGNVIGTKIEGPFVFVWNTTEGPDGAHGLRAIATYKQRTSSADLMVTVANTVVPPPDPEPEPGPGIIYPVRLSDNVQTRLNAIPSGTEANPSIVEFEAGTYLNPSIWQVTGKQWWIVRSKSDTLGGDATLKHTTPVTLVGTQHVGNDSHRLLRFTDCKNITVRCLTFIGASPMPASGDGFKPWEDNVQHIHSLAVVRCENFKVQKVRIDGSGGGDGINWGNENSGFRSTGVIEDCDIRNAHRCTIALVGSGGLTIRRNVFARGGFWMIDLEPNTVESGNFNTVIEDNTWESQGGLLSRCAIGAFAGSKDGRGQCENVTIRNNRFVNRTAEMHFNINGGYPLRIKNVRIEGNTVDISGPRIECRQIDGLNISGNNFAPIPDPEIEVWDSTAVSISGSSYVLH